MTYYNLYEEMWGSAHEDDTEFNISKCILSEGCENEGSPFVFYDETTPVKDCGDLVADDINSYNKIKESLMGESLLQVKRRRTLQFKSEDSQSIDGAVSELSQWVSSFTDNTFEALDISSETWIAECFDDAETYLSFDDIHATSGKSVSPVTELASIPSSSEANVVQDHFVRHSQNAIVKGTNSYLRAPSKSPSAVVYPFDFIKPCGACGDITLKDINQKIRAPSPPKPRLTDEDFSVCYPKSAFSGKPVVGKTKICTEGGKGSITIMRTKG